MTAHVVQRAVESRLLRSIAEELFTSLQTLGSDGRGITRECYSKGENSALDLIVKVAKQHGLQTTIDAAANLIITSPQDDMDTPGLILGSHIDSVPEGGNFDGAAGIIAGLLTMIQLQRDNCFRQEQPVRLLALRGEESAYYGRANMGARALFGRLTSSDLSARRLGNGTTLREAMASVGADLQAIERGERLIGPKLASSYLELHIEQGPVMTARDIPAAIVTGIRGNLRHRRIICRGEEGHSGTVPRWLRRDAIFALADLIMRLDEHWTRLLERGIDLVVTSGVCSTDTERNAISRIPGEVFFSFEVRSQSFDTLEGFYQLFRSECRAVSDARHVRFEFDERVYTEPAKMDERMVGRLQTVFNELGLPAELIPSGAGHDAAVFANEGIPSAMIFVRNKNGSHNPNEHMSIEDFMTGVSAMIGYATLDTY